MNESGGLMLSEIIPDSSPGPIQKSALKQTEDWLSDYLDITIKYPSSFVNDTILNHGGIPVRSCFDAPGGKRRVICRLCNVLRKRDFTNPIEPTWRQWADHDIQLDYSIYSLFNYEHWCVRFQENDWSDGVVPFAVLDTAGHNARSMDSFDLLCFDYGGGNHEPIVTFWEFEAFDMYHSRRNFIAGSYDDFSHMLFDDPLDPIVREFVEHF